MADPISVTDEDLDILARTVDGEAENQEVAGQIAVLWVMRTRADWDELPEIEVPGKTDDDPSTFVPHPEHEWWGTSPAKVCEARYQFSCWLPGPDCNRIKALAPGMPVYDKFRQMAADVFAGAFEDPTASIGGATHYKVRGTPAEWDATVAANNLQPCSIGAHDFYRLGPSA